MENEKQARKNSGRLPGQAPLEATVPVCPLLTVADFSHVAELALHPYQTLADYRAAMALADQEAAARLGDYMLLSWYDRDRDFESPQHASECHEDSAIPGYVDYGLNHGASLKIDIEDGRFVFFYRAVNLA